MTVPKVEKQGQYICSNTGDEGMQHEYICSNTGDEGRLASIMLSKNNSKLMRIGNNVRIIA